jgi:four helix bundle protein
MPPYEQLHAWQACHRLVLSVYRLTRKWPDEEKFGLIAQTRRAAFSSAANIAEGSCRRSAADFARFLNVAFASLGEVGYCLRCAQDLQYLDPPDLLELQKRQADAGALTWKLYAAVCRKRDRER